MQVLQLQMQAAMLITTKKISFRRDAFAPGQVHATVRAPHHILALQGARLFMRFFPLLERPPVASYYPKKKGNDKGEEKNSTHGVGSVGASEEAAHIVNTG
jgi:hypothetical protein